MTRVDHPSNIIPPGSAEILRQFTMDAEHLGELHPVQLNEIYRKNWFNLFVPTELNGLNIALPEALQIEEGLAWTDGSLGWVVTLCCGAAWFSGFLQQDLVEQIFSDPKTCFAGSGQASGIATINENGYEIHGSWKYATGAPHATIFTANCIIEKNGKALKDEKGDPLIKAFLFLDKEVSLVKDWDSSGLIATASHTFIVSRLQVSANRCFSIDTKDVVSAGPVYRYPFLQFAEATLAVNHSGMAIHFLDLCEALVSERKGLNNYPIKRIEIFQTKITAARTALNGIRQEFYNTIDTSWKECMDNRNVSRDLLGSISNISHQLALVSRKQTNELYPYCGLAATRQDSTLNQVWRDIHTASQHPLLNYPNE